MKVRAKINGEWHDCDRDVEQIEMVVGLERFVVRVNTNPDEIQVIKFPWLGAPTIPYSEIVWP